MHAIFISPPEIPPLLNIKYLSGPMLTRATFAGTDSGVYSSPNSPDIRAARQPSYKPTYKRPCNPSRAESQESSRKTSNGSFCDTINSLLAFPSCEVRI